MRALTLLLSACAALVLTGCVTSGDDERQGFDARFYENRTFTDTEIGYTLHFPSGWEVTVATTPYSSLDLHATRKNAEVYIFHTDVWAGETLDQYVAHRTGENWYADSEVVYDAVNRGGVSVRRVDQWYNNDDYVDYEWVRVSVEWRRTLYFYRNGKITTIRISDEDKSYNPQIDFNPIDTSLTFF
jgi:hypothetical protein